jgi:DNA-binding transcriptional MerR regulator
MSSVLITIGDFSRMTHLSVKALRHYHDVGLLEPADVDRDSGYRLYDPGQVPVAQVIRRFRDLGMPVEEIRSMLNAPGTEERNRVIIDHLNRMESHLAETQATVASLRSLLEGPALRSNVEFRSVLETPALAVTSFVGVADFTDWWVETFTSLRETLATCALRRSGPDGALYPPVFFEEDGGSVTAFIPVVTGGSFLVPAAELAVLVHEGDVHDLDRTYGVLGTAVTTQGLGVDGPIREHYLVSPMDGAAPDAYRTEVCWPVLR